MTRRSFKSILTVSLVLMLATVIGCEAGSTRGSRYLYEAPQSTVQSAPKAEPTLPAKDAMAPSPTPSSAASWPTMRTDGTTNWTAMAFPTGDAITSVVGVEKGYPKEARLNQQFSYKILVTNLTKNTLDSVSLAEDLGQNVKYVSSLPSGSLNGSQLSWTLGTLKPQETKTMLVNVTPTSQGSVGSCASVTYASALCASVPVVSPQLEVVKTGPAEVVKCDEIVYNIEVSNTGSGSISGVKVVDALPRGIQTIDGKSTVEIAVGTLEAGATKRYAVRAKASAKGKYENKVTASGDGDMKAESGVVSTMVREPVLKITKTGPKDSYTSVPFTYEITVTNSGDAIATNTTVEDMVPAGTTLIAASDRGAATGGKVVWALGSLAPGASKKVTMTLRGDMPGTVKNVATARASCAEAVVATAETALKGIPAILLEVIDLADPIKVGDNVTYRVTVTNQGTASDSNIKIVCTLEENQQFVSATGATTGTAAGSTITLQPLASLAPKAQAVWSVTVKNVKAGDVRFKVSMTSENLTRPVEETEATNVWE